jgi:hypothetical protein
MYSNTLVKTVLFFVISLLLVSCDKEYSAVGDALIGENNFDLVQYTSKVIANNEKVTPIQSSNLPINALGIYDNPAFGKTVANFATQVTLASINPTIGIKPEIVEVYLEVPYFSTKISTDFSTGDSTYKLDSIYGEAKSKIKLSIYESGRYMGTQNGAAQIFYTNQNAEFDNLKIGNRLNDASNEAQNDQFFFDPAEIKITSKDAAGNDVVTRKAPTMRLKLNSDFFKDKILNAPSGSLVSNDAFVHYFKGLYFKVEQSGAEKGSLCMINFAKGTITIKYKEDASDKDATRVDKSIVLNLSASTANLLEQTNTNTDYLAATTNPNRVQGDEKLYLKGGEGSVAVLSLFDKKDVMGYDKDGNLTGPNGISDELDTIRKEGWLINEASLVFNIDAATMSKSAEPQRIYVYDYANNTPIVDYFLDPTPAPANKPKKAKIVLDGNLNLDPTTKRGANYRVRITNHIRNLVKSSDNKNVPLGVAVTESIAISDSYPFKDATVWISEAPRSSVMNPLGTVIYGGSSSSNPTDKNLLKLEIYYTKPK